MATIIDWHAHHTAPEIADRIKELTGKTAAYRRLRLPGSGQARARKWMKRGWTCNSSARVPGCTPINCRADSSAGNRPAIERRISGARRAAQRSLDGHHRVIAQEHRGIGAGSRAHRRPGLSRRLAVSSCRRRDAGRHPGDGTDLCQNFRVGLTDISPWRGHGAGPDTGAARRRRCRSCLCRVFRRRSRRVLPAHDRQRFIRPLPQFAHRYPQLRRRYSVVAASLFLEAQRTAKAKSATRKFFSNTFSSIAPARMRAPWRFSSTRWARTISCSVPITAAGLDR